MNLLATLSMLLTEDTSISLQINRKGADLQVITLPKIANFQPDTKDAELAAIQAALVQPLVFTLAAGLDPDAEFARLLREAAEIRQPALDQLAAYREAQRQSQQVARIAQEKKAATPAKKADKPAPAKPVAGPAADAAGEGEGIALEALAGNTSTPTVNAPADPVAVDLF